MNKSQDDLIIVDSFQLTGRPAPTILTVQRYSPLPGWIKVNTDGAANGSPGLSGCSGVIQTYHGFCIGCFAVPLGVAFAYEAELLGVITAIHYAF